MIRFHLHGYGEFDAVRRIGPCVWPHFDLLFIHDGHVSIRLGGRADGQEVELRSGESILIFPHTPFRGQSIAESSRASVQHFAIEGRAQGVRPPFDELARLRRGFRVYGERIGRRIEADVDRAMRLAVLAPSPLVQEMREAALTLIFGQLVEVEEGTHRRDPRDEGGAVAADFDAVIAWAEENLHRGPTVDDLAGRAGLSPSHFRALFARRVGR
ncbi:MAG: hypothetical protein WBD40_03165, partial [Tepidisphaeraceae bacterium]